MNAPLPERVNALLIDLVRCTLAHDWRIDLRDAAHRPVFRHCMRCQRNQERKLIGGDALGPWEAL